MVPASAGDQRSQDLFFDGLRRYLPELGRRGFFQVSPINVETIIHVTSLSEHLAERLGDADETWVEGSSPLGLIVAWNDYPPGPDDDSWGALTLLPWAHVLSVSNEQYLAERIIRRMREGHGAASAPGSPSADEQVEGTGSRP